MSKDVIDGKWKQMRAPARDWPGQHAGDNVDRAAKFEQLIGVLDEQYGYDGERAERELTHQDMLDEHRERWSPVVEAGQKAVQGTD